MLTPDFVQSRAFDELVDTVENFCRGIEYLYGKSPETALFWLLEAADQTKLTTLEWVLRRNNPAPRRQQYLMRRVNLSAALQRLKQHPQTIVQDGMLLVMSDQYDAYIVHIMRSPDAPYPERIMLPVSFLQEAPEAAATYLEHVLRAMEGRP